MKKFDAYLKSFQNLIFGESVQRFEDKLLLSSTLFISLVHIFSVAFNILMGLKFAIIFTSILGSLFFLVLYFIVRSISRSEFVFFLSSSVMLLFIDLVWFVNYGSNGPVMLFFIILYAFLILLFRRKYYLIITVIVLLNVASLYAIESSYSEIIGNYVDHHSRLADNYTGLIFSILVILSFLAAIKNNYIQESERAKMSDQLKSSFLANMSHEIRTPLNAIVGFSSLIIDPDIPAEDKKSFEGQVQRNSDYLLGLIEDIIDVSKIETNQLTIRIRDIDVVPVISQIVQSFQLTIPATQNLKVVTGIEDQQLVVKSDALRLEQIIRNLLSNAVKFTEEGTVEVGCAKGQQFFTFWVKDSGIGIHAHDQLVIFDRFMKIENNKQHLYRGTGIGLFLSKQLVEILGGKIWVESEVGKGTTFFFTIPV